MTSPFISKLVALKQAGFTIEESLPVVDAMPLSDAEFLASLVPVEVA